MRALALERRAQPAQRSPADECPPDGRKAPPRGLPGPVRVEQLRACSLVLTTYRAGDTRRGTIGVLGPTRMRYSQVAPRLRYVSLRVGQALDRLLG